ncbi:carbohydrate-binding module family 13 protein [Sporormia fimetaria CBS 119925]|uniref:Carbohydrate-binding module family 13 protein n=1 Tax=Sporormia fimetaria CBS 119925 TaxID=1340428 RepID=A0A6A6UZA7_9PLEO|nr:carbohydrate-binding module family 13 protein [Sporormia fimetaria CBS 119925]
MLSTSAVAQTTPVPVTPPEGYRTVYITSLVDAKFVVVPKAPVRNGTTLVVQTRTNAVDQQWYIKANSTRIQLAATTLCMDGGPRSNWKDMAPIYLTECSETSESQKWLAMADGRIAMEGSPAPQQCIDLQYMRATQNNPVGFYTCAGLGNTGARDKGINWPLVNVTSV